MFRACPLLLKEKRALDVSCPPKFEMLPTSLVRGMIPSQDFQPKRKENDERFGVFHLLLLLRRYLVSFAASHSQKMHSL